jgi:hypothetical protein
MGESILELVRRDGGVTVAWGLRQRRDFDAFAPLIEGSKSAVQEPIDLEIVFASPRSQCSEKGRKLGRYQLTAGGTEVGPTVRHLAVIDPRLESQLLSELLVDGGTRVLAVRGRSIELEASRNTRRASRQLPVVAWF